MRRNILGLVLALVSLGGALAQGTIQQAGAVVPFHPPVFLANGVQADGGTVAAPNLSQLGLFNGVNCPLGVSSQTGPGNAVTPHSQFSVCQSDTTTTVNIQGINGEPAPNLVFDIGGTLVPFPGPGAGGVLTRAQVPTTVVGVPTVMLGGYYAQGDLGAGCLYTSQGATAGGLQAIQDAAGTWYNLVVAGPLNAGCFGAHGDYAFSAFAGSIAGNTLTIPASSGTGNLTANPQGTVAIGQCLHGSGIAANTCITAGTGPTYTLSGSPQTLGLTLTGSSISSTTLTVGGVTGGSILGGAIISGAGVTANTQIITQLTGPAGGAGTYTVTASQSVSSETMTGTVYFASDSGHDDTAAIQAAFNANPDVRLQGLPCSGQATSGTTSFFGVSSTLTLPAEYQKLEMHCAALQAMPTWSGTTNPALATSYVLNLNGAHQITHDLVIDAGQKLGVAQAGGVFMGQGNQTLADTSVLHSGLAGICECGASGDQSINGFNVTEFASSEPQFLARTNFTGDGVRFASGDDAISNGVARWAAIPLHFAAGSGTIRAVNLHPYNGNGGIGAVPANPVNIQFDPGAGGNDQFSGVYTDNGTIEVYTQSQSLRGVFPLAQTTSSTFSPAAFVRVYATGQNGSPFAFNLASLPSPSPAANSEAMVQYLPNPNLIATTAASGDSVHGTLTLTAWPTTSPEPSTSGLITVAGVTPAGYNCTACAITAHTPTSVTYACSGACTGAQTIAGTVQAVWAGDYTAVNAIVPGSGTSVETLPKVLIYASTSGIVPILDYYNPAGLGLDQRFTAENATPCHQKWTPSATILLLGCGSGNTILMLGDEASATQLTDDGLKNFTITNNAACHLLVASNGPVRPCTDAANGLGSSVVRWSNVFALADSLGANLWESNTTPTVTSGLGTSPSAFTGTTAAAIVTVGASGSPATTEVVGMPTAATGWACTSTDRTTNVTARETATSVSSVTFTWSAAPSNSDVLQQQCAAY